MREPTHPLEIINGGAVSGAASANDGMPERQRVKSKFKKDGEIMRGVQWYVDQPFGEVKFTQFGGYDLLIRSKLAYDHDTPLALGLEDMGTIYLIPPVSEAASRPINRATALEMLKTQPTKFQNPFLQDAIEDIEKTVGTSTLGSFPL